MGRSWADDPYHFTRKGKPSLTICCSPKGYWLHEIREGLRHRDYTTLCKDRRFFEGIEHGIGRTGSFGLLNDKGPTPHLSPYEKGVLRCCQSGALQCQEGLGSKGVISSTKCIICDQNVDKTELHLLWQCSATASTRRRFWPDGVPPIQDLPGF